MTIVIGINAYHGDSSACIIVDGKLVAAAEEERFRRIKHWAGFPSESIRYCLSEAGLTLGDVNYFAINQNLKANLWRKIFYTIRYKRDLQAIIDRLKNNKKRLGFMNELRSAFPGQFIKAEFRHIEHHLSHLASAHIVSPFTDSSVISVDGFGDFSSAAWGVGHGSDISIEGRVFFPHSLGIFYQALTQYLGFPNYGDEYKVMGLAPYGRPKFLDKLRQIIKLHNDGSFSMDLSYFRHHRENVEYEWEGGTPHVGSLYSPKLIELLGPAREVGADLSQHHRDIARSIQAMYEEAFFHLLNTLYAHHRLDALTLAGGCAMNSVANGRIYANTSFKRLYVQSAAGDAGGAIGAAYALWSEIGSGKRFHMEHAYWGPQYSDSEVSGLLDAQVNSLKNAGCDIKYITEEDILFSETATAISRGHVIGWFQGRMEWGPRALGNRSILGDPRRANMKDILNLKIKRRESFRPFAPSIIREAVSEWFEQDDDVPFMMQVYPIRPDKRKIVPAITHIDGSGRLQTVSLNTNPRYYKLIKAFQKITDVPILLNTSFNENEPVVCRPEEALDCFLRTKMDMLILGNWVIRREVQI